ncbi:uncharacterized protein N7483_000302 [Penicillium malachiteum]|uniref:uncharacterized protein n=1 Tax=Penicillium malachiteum TaxID=1324776 RepID=UPI00254890C2|nr:uncharacterized protein N7483_000302 [Penicillium malachiteum]KAJ5735177.1 hypothetical protein N7483_000302 [Penicillium malachiteum]
MSCICGNDSRSPTPDEARRLLQEERDEREERGQQENRRRRREQEGTPAPNGNGTPDPDRPHPQPADDELGPAPPAPAPVVQEGRDPIRDRKWLQDRGTQVVEWIDNPDSPDCFVNDSFLTLQQLSEYPDAAFSSVGPPDDAYATYFAWATEPAEWMHWVIWFGMDSWSGMTANGVIVMGSISRTENSDHPFTSDIALALYANQFESTDSLRHILFDGVVNAQTRSLVAQHLYRDEDQLGEDIRQWEHGSQEYFELMGTRIGRVAAYTVLSAFPRGSHRISRIVTDFEPGALSVDIRFDIEAVSNYYDTGPVSPLPVDTSI